MMKKLKRYMLTVTAAIMVASTLFGCGTNKTVQTESSVEKAAVTEKEGTVGAINPFVDAETLYIATVCEGESGLTYAEEIHGMWDVDRYIHLLMGEIPRLTDNAGGYGPTGKQFIAHVDIPENVQSAFDLLRTQYGRQIREADPMFASD